MRVLSPSQVDHFKEQGYLVIEDVLSPTEIAEAREGLYASLRSRGVDLDDPSTLPNIRNLSSTHGAGGVLDIFYDDWKMKLIEHSLILHIMQDLWEQTFAFNSDPFSHPYGIFDSNKAYAYIDRICFRLPDSLSTLYGSKKKPLQRGLAPHLDCCPHNMFAKDAKKWKPIQAFISLTDTLNKDEGGFECCPGIHKNFSRWAENRTWTLDQYTGERVAPVCVGEFTPIRPVEDADIIEHFVHIPCIAGSIVLWDNRIPHANSRFNRSSRVREAVYIGNLATS